MDRSIDTIRERFGQDPARLAIVLGSGLGGFADLLEDVTSIDYADLPGWHRTGVAGHPGKLLKGSIEGRPVLVLQGRSHYYEAGNPRAMAGPIDDLAELGVKALLLTNAAGSVHERLRPGDLMIVEDHINWSGTNPLIGETGSDRFVDMSRAYSPRLLFAMRTAATSAGIKYGQGTYMWFSGPSFETPAEIRMARLLGAMAVGMSTVPEVILARRRGLEVGALSLITNMGTGMSGESLSHAHTQEQAGRSAAKAYEILKAVVREAA